MCIGGGGAQCGWVGAVYVYVQYAGVCACA